MCGVPHECTGAFFCLHNGGFAELISAHSAASPAVLGVGVHIHEAPVSPAGAPRGSATQRRSRSAHAAEVTQCCVAGSGGRGGSLPGEVVSGPRGLITGSPVTGLISCSRLLYLLHTTALKSSFKLVKGIF